MASIDLIKVDLIELKKRVYNIAKIDLWSIKNILSVSIHEGARTNFLIELWATFLFSIILMKTKLNVTAIGFPCKKDKINKIDRFDISLLTNMVVTCSEFDTTIYFLKDKKQYYYKIQIVRYFNQKYKDLQTFYNFLLDTKLKKYPQDDELYLLIYIEENIRFEYVKLNELLSSNTVPFAGIFAIGHIGLKKSVEFMGVKIYPNIEGPITINFRKEPPG
jgi:hypothetical protein